MDKTKVIHNPGLRFLSKLMLNSFWGKFGQREDLSQIELVTNYDDLIKMLINPDIVLESFVIINEYALLVSYKTHSLAQVPLNTVNVSIAAYTTAGARLELLKYLQNLDDRILYFDTDSIIFTQKSNEPMPETGEYLGQMTNELSVYGPDSYITEFVSAGPKNYAYKVYSPTTNEYHQTCKVKGITLNYLSSQTINFELVKEIVTQDPSKIVSVLETKILRTDESQIFTAKRTKKYALCYTKRRRLNNFDTLPFGYCD